MFYVVVETQKHADCIRLTDPDFTIVVAGEGNTVVSLATSIAIQDQSQKRRVLALMDAHTTHERSIRSHHSDLRIFMQGDSALMFAFPNLFEDKEVIGKVRKWFNVEGRISA